MIVVIGILVVAACALVLRSRPEPLAVGPDGRPAVGDVLIRRFLDRSQRFRRNGAVVGIVLMVAVAMMSVSLDGEGGAAVNLVTLASVGLAGSIGGSILAEAFRVRRRGPRIASLDVRDPDAYRDRTAEVREVIVLALAGTGAVAALVTGERPGRAAALGAAVVALALVRRWAVHRIALRPRPVLPAEVEVADDTVRRLAASAGVSRPMVTLGALLVAAQWSGMAADPAGSSSDAALAVVGWFVSVGLFVAACWWWATNRSFGLAPDRLRGVGGLRSHLGWWVLGTVAAVVALAALVVLARGGS